MLGGLDVKDILRLPGEKISGHRNNADKAAMNARRRPQLG